MTNTSDNLPTEHVESPAMTGDVQNDILSPRFTAEGVETRTTQGIWPNRKGQQGTNAPNVSGRFEVVSDETSDRLPTNPLKTSDRPDAVDVVFRGAIQQLRLISQSPASSLERQSRSAEKGLSLFVDDVAGDLARRYEGTSRIKNTERCFKIRHELAEAALVALREARYAPRGNWIDRQTIEGRYRVAIDPRPATIVAGIYDVPLSTVYRWRAQLPYFREKLRLQRK